MHPCFYGLAILYIPWLMEITMQFYCFLYLKVSSMAFFNRYALLVLLYCILFSSYNENRVEGLSKEEDLELEKHLKLLNKPAIKTVQMKYGGIYDCVDFYKQPAFDHPLLYNHTFHYQMRPSSVPKNEKVHFTTKKNAQKMGLQRVGCPVGTVPIRRTSKDDLVRAKLHEKRYGSKYSMLTTDNPFTHYAVVMTKFDPNKKYNGGSSSISIYNPSPVLYSQYSSARMMIQTDFDSIQVGWTVNPTLYGDNLTHLYTYLNTSQSRCFNTQCPGFVLVNTDIPIDSVFDPVSQRGGDVFFTTILIYKDKANGNWWLQIDNDQVGFWPQRIFTGLAGMANSIQWGGEVFSPRDIPSPPMGNGYYLSKLEGTEYDAFCKMMATINDAHEVVDVENTIKYTDSGFYYNVKDEGNVKRDLRRLMFFGGPGGKVGD